MIELPKHSDLLKLPEQLYGTIKKVGVLNNKPILYGDVNLLKPGDLFYFTSAHQIYRYVKSSFNPVHTESVSPVSEIGGSIADIGGSISDPIRPESIKLEVSYIFEEIEPMLDEFMLNGLTIPDEQRGTIKRVGKLFNKIIYSGDPNLVDNGNLYYHEAFPLISTVGINDGVITLSADWIGMYGNVSTMNVEYRVSPSPHDYSKDYLTFEALEDCVFGIEILYDSMSNNYITTEMRESFSYSIDNGNTWETWEMPNDTYSGTAITTPTIKAGEKILWKGIGRMNCINAAGIAACIFKSDKKYNASGNILSLFYGDDFKDYDVFPEMVTVGSAIGSSLGSLFQNIVSKTTNYIISAENLILPSKLKQNCYKELFAACEQLTTPPALPAKALTKNCYKAMFNGCSLLEVAPELPATTLADYCYSSMFSNCTSLTSAPELPVTALASNCYSYMFSGCTSLTSAPKLPATTLESNCYQSMFYGCTALTTAPELLAETLATECYVDMFNGCSKLNYVKAMFLTTPGYPTNRWLQGVSATGTFIKNSKAEWTSVGSHAVPSGWTVETADA